MAETIAEVDANDINATAPTGVINSFFLTPTYPNKMNNIINLLKDLKITRYTDAESKFIKISKSIISPFLCKLINNCFSKGVYPNYLKTAEVIPIFKKGDGREASKLLSQFDKIYSCIINTLTTTPDIRSLPLPPQLCCGAAVSSVTAAKGGGWCVFCSF